MIRTRQISSPAELETFAGNYMRAGGFHVEADYLARSRTYACFHGDRMVGGFVVNETDRLRALQDMPAEEADRLRQESAHLRPYEIMCLWMDRDLRGRPLGTAIWLRALSEVGRRPGRRLILCTVQEGLMRLYRKGDPEILYRGDIPMPDGSVLPKYVLAFDRWTPIARAAAHEAVRRSAAGLRRSLPSPSAAVRLIA